MNRHDGVPATRGAERRMEDRRNGINDVVRALARHVTSGEPAEKLLAVFEERLASAMGADWVRTVRPGGADPPGARAPTRVCEVPGPTPGRDMLFEVA